MMDFGYAGAISKSRNFSGWQKKYTKSENDRYLGQCQNTLPLHILGIQVFNPPHRFHVSYLFQISLRR
jgi:hypothetical protein